MTISVAPKLDAPPVAVQVAPATKFRTDTHGLVLTARFLLWATRRNG